MNSFDYCIYGAGLAGLHVAKSLRELAPSSRIIVIDPKGIGGGASGVPIGLVNPATGRYATKSWRAEDSIQSLFNNFKELENYTTAQFSKKSGVIRPAADEKIASRMFENYTQTSWKNDWVDWLDETQINEQFPGLHCVKGGLMIYEAATIAIPKYLEALYAHLTEKSVQFVINDTCHINHSNNEWLIQCDNNQDIIATNLIITSGVNSKEFQFFEELPLIPVKGQLSIFKSDIEFPYQQAVSALGYYASLDCTTFVAGSTYEHRFEHENPDEYGAEYVSNRLFKIIPELVGHAKLLQQWSGVRASTPDRMPIVGTHPTIGNCYTLCGLGSKGLLYSSILGEELASHIINKTTIPLEVHINRFY